MLTKKITGLAACLGLGVLICVSGCGGAAGASVPSTRAYMGTQAPGDVWDWNISNGTFTATNETKGYTYAGTESVLTTGFMKLELTSTTDPGASAGQSAYALEFPGTALLIKPAGDDANPPIMAGALGSNPPGPTVNFNFVSVPKLGWDAVTEPAYGTASFSVSGNDYTGTISKYLINDTLQSTGPGSFTMVGGRMTVGEPAGVTAAMTPTGVFVLDFGPGAGGVIGVKQPASNIDLADVASKGFKGFLVNQGKTQCVTVISNGDGTLHGTGYALGGGVETGESDAGGGVTITFNSQPAPGLAKISLVTSGGPENLVVSIAQVNGKYMLFAFGSPVNPGDNPYNVLLVQN